MERHFRQYDVCRQDEKPFCTGRCPFHLDVPKFITKMEAGNYHSAYRTLQDAFGFPGVVAALCPEYCASACQRRQLDQPVQLNLLEKTCAAKTEKKEPQYYNLPARNRKVGIIGAGGSGLACALRLAQEKYEVTIWEKTDKWGGVLWERLPSSIFLEDIERQFQFEQYNLFCNAEIRNLEELRDCGMEAVYIATGKNGQDFGALNRDDSCYISEQGMGIFAGGALTGEDPVSAIARGLEMAKNIGNFFKTGKAVCPAGSNPCRGKADLSAQQKKPAVHATDHGLFAQGEATAEARRCMRCKCNACTYYCDVSRYHSKEPKRLRDDVMATVAFSASPSIIKKTPAKRMINTCTQCGLCKEICPEGIDTGAMFLEARRALHRQGTIPGPYHQFWLRDMEFANREPAAITKRAPGQKDCCYAFFPGCQLGASEPHYVMEPYRWLLSKRPDTGLLLSCCGLPAEWAGDETEHQNVIDGLRKKWESLGRPILITACISCEKHLRKYLPEIETVTLYELMDSWECPPEEEKELMKTGETFSVFDPCSARHERKIQKAVRNLAKRAGLLVEELPQGEKHGCCGYGGQISEVNTDYYSDVIKNRCSLSQNPYLVYCINCRDTFKGEGKKTLHLLQLFFPAGTEEEQLPNWSKRRQNRLNLKEQLLQEIWGQEMRNDPQPDQYRLKIGAKTQEKMNTLKILEEDVCQVIKLGETTGRRVYDPARASFTCYRESGYLTFWVEYRKEDGEYVVLDAYSHRMKIELERVWNGRKKETDL
ncbi:heterodisulfide reductase-related iron-sulfur binding cluster [Eubacteriales bacterium DFI.9.88]|nr:heterodisulfide reductase-related iron-sulfur binding cluster [Eubacteriales bacterium DFI.9.88]